MKDKVIFETIGSEELEIISHAETELHNKCGKSVALIACKKD